MAFSVLFCLFSEILFAGCFFPIIEELRISVGDGVPLFRNSRDRDFAVTQDVYIDICFKFLSVLHIQSPSLLASTSSHTHTHTCEELPLEIYAENVPETLTA